MNPGNGYDNHRLDVVEADARDLRQLVVDALAKLDHVYELVKLTNATTDTILAELRLKDVQEEAESG